LLPTKLVDKNGFIAAIRRAWKTQLSFKKSIKKSNYLFPILKALKIILAKKRTNFI